MTTLRTLFCALSLALLLPSVSNADIFAIYDFDDGAPGGLTESVFPNPPTTVVPGMYDTRSGVTQNGSANPFGGIATPTNGGDVHAFVEADETPIFDEFNNPGGSNNAYHEFSVTTPSGSGTYALDSIHVEYWVANPEAGATYRATVYSDLVGYGNSSLQLGTIEAELEPSQSRTRTIDLREFASSRTNFSRIQGGQTVEFRILFSDDSDGQTFVDHHRVDDVTVRGRVVVAAVPEPAAGTILILCTGLAALIRRRSQI